MSAPITEYKRDYFLTAGETDAQGLMPMSLIFARAIEIATEHANRLGIGYANLLEHGIGWVLTRMSVVMDQYPAINDHYSFVTWIEGYNRLYSDRCFAILNAEGREIGHIRSMWVAIDMQKRSAADLTTLDPAGFPIGSRPCPVPQQRKLPPLPESARSAEYTFRYADIDFNRHVNTIQYVRQIMNMWSLDFFDRYIVRSFEIAFHQECHFDDTVTIRVEDLPQAARCEILRQGKRTAACSISFNERPLPAQASWQ